MEKPVSVLYFDCFSGAAGDMILGALIDAGVPLEGVRAALGSLAIAADTVWVDRVTRAGISAAKFSVRGEAARLDRSEEDDAAAGHRHPHGHPHQHEVKPDREGELPAGPDAHAHEHRTLQEIFALIDRSALSCAAKDRARQLFQELGEAEAAIHGTPIEEVHLHEVGALDSIIDIVGTVFAMEWLAVSRVVSSPLNVGSGSIRSAHGRYPVPAPATLRLLRNVPIYSGPQAAEMVTPTGALLIKASANEFATIPAMRVRTIGYGAGTRDFADTPNVLRVLIGEAEDAAALHEVIVIEAEIDDMNPQIFGVLMDRLLAEGALDVFYTAIQMKKNRPGTLMTVVAAPGQRERLTATIFRETTTIGVRYRQMMRDCLAREIVIVATPFGDVRLKVARRDGAILNAAPEFDDCARLAAQSGRPFKDVQAAATKAFLDHQQR
jgi:uncharacterized protein (TIGR00299 family) protein